MVNAKVDTIVTRVVLKHRLILGPGRQMNQPVLPVDGPHGPHRVHGAHRPHGPYGPPGAPGAHGAPGAPGAHGAPWPMGPTPPAGRRPTQINTNYRLISWSPRLNQAVPDHQPTLSNNLHPATKQRL